MNTQSEENNAFCAALADQKKARMRRSAAALRPIARTHTGGRQDQGQAWRPHLRQHAPPPPDHPPTRPGRVHNVFHHIADLSLPYELWTEDAELAAIAHLLGSYTEEDAAQVPKEMRRPTAARRD